MHKARIASRPPFPLLITRYMHPAEAPGLCNALVREAATQCANCRQPASRRPRWFEIEPTHPGACSNCSTRMKSWGDAVSGNRLLAVMTASDIERLRPSREAVTLEQGQILFQADEPITHVYFPHEGVVSLQVLDSEGAVVEAATIGNEGMVGLGGMLAHDVSFTRQLVQLPGRAARIPRDAFLAAVGRSASLRGLLHGHADAFTAQVLQTSACNAQHSTEERMARWLLMAFDRCGTDRVNLTHDDLAVAFGVRRPTVTLVVRSLQAAQILEATRRTITVVDRPGLEQISCECYAAIMDNYRRVFSHHLR